MPKSDGTLRLYVNYRGFNRITIRNRYALPFIGNFMLRVYGVKFFIKINIKEAYYRLYIALGYEWKTAFRTRYSYYEYFVLLFSLINALATF